MKIEKKILIQSENGLHARPAGMLVKEAQKFQSNIQIQTQGGELKNAKSILSLMSLGLVKGASVTLIVEGPDATQAIEALVHVFKTLETQND